MLKIVLLFFVSILHISCVAQDKGGIGNGSPKIFVSFKIDDETVNIKGDFRLFTSVNGKMIPIEVNENEVILPSFSAGTEVVDVIFVYNRHELRFKNVEIEMLRLDQDVNWTFILKHKPFKEPELINIDWDKVKKIHYWEINPLEEGEGIVFIEPVY
jgi:hypothetical protein